jgi:hypothetical protein
MSLVGRYPPSVSLLRDLLLLRICRVRRDEREVLLIRGGLCQNDITVCACAAGRASQFARVSALPYDEL